MASMASEKKASSVSDVGAWAMNVISSVGIIMANKQVMSTQGYDFRFGKYEYLTSDFVQFGVVYIYDLLPCMCVCECLCALCVGMYV